MDGYKFISEVVLAHPDLPWSAREVGYLYMCGLVRGQRRTLAGVSKTMIKEDDLLRLVPFLNKKSTPDTKEKELLSRDKKLARVARAHGWQRVQLRSHDHRTSYEKSLCRIDVYLSTYTAHVVPFTAWSHPCTGKGRDRLYYSKLSLEDLGRLFSDPMEFTRSYQGNT